MLDMDSTYVKFCLKNDIGIAVIDYQFSAKAIRIFLDKEYKKIIYYNEIKEYKVANYDDEMVYLLDVNNYRVALIVDKKKNRNIIKFLSNKLER